LLIVARALAGAGILNSVSKMMVFARMVAIFFVVDDEVCGRWRSISRKWPHFKEIRAEKRNRNLMRSTGLGSKYT
jgi:hypothetical protein